jgi:hypothetical protein
LGAVSPGKVRTSAEEPDRLSTDDAPTRLCPSQLVMGQQDFQASVTHMFGTEARAVPNHPKYSHHQRHLRKFSNLGTSAKRSSTAEKRARLGIPGLTRRGTPDCAVTNQTYAKKRADCRRWWSRIAAGPPRR